MNHIKLATFLRELSEYNDKAWFEAHRTEYDGLRAEFTDLVGAVIAGIHSFDPAIGELEAARSLFRINRDVRFSKDKRPYKTNFSAMLQPGGKKSGIPGYYLHIDKTGELLVAAGFHELTPEQLGKVRTAIATEKSALGAAMTEGIKRGLKVMEEDKLKKVPRGWPTDHPQAELLKLKHAVLYREMAIASDSDLTATILDQCHQLVPFLTALRAVLSQSR